MRISILVLELKLHNIFTNPHSCDIIYQDKKERLDMAKINYTLEIVELKYQTMKKRIETLKNTFGIISDIEMGKKGTQKLEELEAQYDRMYEAILRQEVYESYGEVEKSIISYLARLEGKLEEYVYHIKDEVEKRIMDVLGAIPNSENYKDFKDMDGSLKKISGLEELLKLYSGYCTKEKREMLQKEVSDVKFDCLLRAQIELMLEGKRRKRKHATLL